MYSILRNKKKNHRKQDEAIYFKHILNGKDYRKECYA